MRATFLRVLVRLCISGIFLMSGYSAALQSLDDGEMSGVTGEGMSFVWTDFRMMFAPDSYLEQMGSPSNNTCTGTGTNAGNANCMRRADLRWFGLNISAAGNAVGQSSNAAWNTSWTTTASGDMTQCANAGVNGLGCPRGGPIKYFAAPDNPYVLRVNNYAAGPANTSGGGSTASVIGNGIVTYQGNTGAADWKADGTGGSGQTVLEFTAPALTNPSGQFSHRNAQDDYRFSFWGEIESGRGGSGGGMLKSQTMIKGNAAGSVMRYFKFTQTATSPGLAIPFDPTKGAGNCTDSGCPATGTGSTYNNRTLAIAYDSYLHGDFRFSVAQANSCSGLSGSALTTCQAGTDYVPGAINSDAAGVAVDFDAREGMYFLNADVHVALGQPFYQALTINMPRNSSTNAPTKDGNFTLEIPLIPNIEAVYTRFYSLTNYANTAASAPAPNAFDDGYATARAAYLNSLPVMGGTTNSGFMPGASSALPTCGASPTAYCVPDANYAKTHGYAHWGDWSICQGVGCSMPLGVNTVAQALAGTGRNAWNSAGDGVFFIGKTDFNAYAYSGISVDVRPNDNTYTSISYYKGSVGSADKTVDVRTDTIYVGATETDQTRTTASSNVGFFSACTATVASPYQCGYGGSYLGAAEFGKNTDTVSIIPAERSWYNTGASMGTATNRPVISVPKGTALNLGDARLEGIQMNYLRFTSYGALY
ncbi:MAG: hypothetical protein REI12_02490 [Pedobacter sp.]|nr:hypothetical protein [Pedobacter sp.]